MKILKFILCAGITLLLVFCLAVFIFIKTFDVDQLRSRIEQEIHTRTGRDVTMDHIDLAFSWNKGVVLNLEGLTMKEDPDISPGISFSAGRITVDADIVTFLKKRDVLAVKFVGVENGTFTMTRLPQDPALRLVLAEIDIRINDIFIENPSDIQQGWPVLRSLQAQGRVVVDEGRLMNLNILRVLLDKISMIPNLSERIEENLPPQYREKLKRNGTVLKKMELDFKIHDGRIAVDNAQIASDVFLLTAKGGLDWQQNLNVQATVFIPADLSSGMLAGAGELKGLLEKDGRIKIPLKPYNGKMSSVKLLPDLRYLGARILRTTGKQEIRKLLDKVFNRGEDAPEIPGSVREQGEKIIENIFDSIFK